MRTPFESYIPPEPVLPEEPEVPVLPVPVAEPAPEPAPELAPDPIESYSVAEPAALEPSFDFLLFVVFFVVVFVVVSEAPPLVPLIVSLAEEEVPLVDSMSEGVSLALDDVPDSEPLSVPPPLMLAHPTPRPAIRKVLKKTFGKCLIVNLRCCCDL